MGQAIPNENCDPDTLKMLGRAFDAAWLDIAASVSDTAVEERRIRLALIILELARDGHRREQEIKAAALDIVRRSQKPAVHRTVDPDFRSTALRLASLRGPQRGRSGQAF